MNTGKQYYPPPRLLKVTSFTNSLLSMVIFSLVFFLPSFFPDSLAAQSQEPVTKGFEKTLLTEDWQGVLQFIGESQELAPIMRFLKGHACLAVNRNTDSFCLFLSATRDADLNPWLNWTAALSRNNGAAALSHYFYGDALARLQQWDGALDAFNKALDLSPTNTLRALILDARGVTYAAKKDYRRASSDFQEAIKANPKLADAYASRGELNMVRKEGPKQALAQFNLALDLSPNFALALHNRGCIRLLLNEPDGAMDDLEKAEKYGQCASPVWLENRLRIMAYSSGINQEDFLALQQSGKKPGTLVSVRFEKVRRLWEAYKNNPTQGKFNTFEGNWGRMTPNERTSFYNLVMRGDLKNNIGLRQQYYIHENTVSNTNKPGGWTDRNNIAITSLAGAVTVANTLNPELCSKAGLASVVAGVGVYRELANRWKAENFHNMETLATLDKRAFPGDFNKTGQNKMAGIDTKQTPLGSMSTTSQIKPGGIDMKLAPITDDGNWPFFASFGLLYPFKTN